MADTKISNLPSAGALAGTEPLPIVQGGATKQTTVQDIANLVNIISKQNISIEVSASITAALNQYYIATATATFTDPTPSQGKGFIVLVRNGTATIGGTAYATAGTLIYRYYHSGAWVNYEFSTSLTAASVHTFVDNLTALVTPADADRMIIVDNSASLAKKITWANIKATLKTYFDSLYITTDTVRNLYITTGDQSISNTPSTVNITGLSINTVANKRYAFDGFIRVGCSSTGGVKFTVTAPSGSTLNVAFTGPAAPNSANGTQQFINSSGTLTAALANANSSLGIIKIYGEVSTGATTGTIQVAFALGVSNQTAFVYQNGTNIVYTER